MRTGQQAASALSLAATAAPPAEADAALCDAPGAQVGIPRLIEAPVPRLKADAQIGHFFRATATRHLVDRLPDPVCELSGGPCRLDAPVKKEALPSMQIAPTDFNRLVELLPLSLHAQGLPWRLQKHLLALRAPMHRDIVTATGLPD